jgi:predicted hotdog family 3-hydroxylacyl-ACP dehydratase
MCLLDRVARWDETRIVCHAAATALDHPFAGADGVPVVASVEYAAQAAALHSALLDDNREPRGGMLATLSEVELTLGCLDQGSSALTVQANSSCAACRAARTRSRSMTHAAAAPADACW